MCLKFSLLLIKIPDSSQAGRDEMGEIGVIEYLIYGFIGVNLAIVSSYMLQLAVAKTRSITAD